MIENQDEIKEYVKMSILTSKQFKNFIRNLKSQNSTYGKIHFDELMQVISKEIPEIISEFQFDGVRVLLKILEEIEYIILPKTKKHWKLYYKISLPYWIKIGHKLKNKKQKTDRAWRKYPWLPSNLSLQTFHSKFNPFPL